MSSGMREEINFWPGYVDALINVLLNLLFLVGIFTVGLVVLNMQAAMIEKEQARQKVREMLEGSSPQEQQRKAKAMLEKLQPPVPPASPPQTAEAQAQEVQSKEIRVRRKPVAPIAEATPAETSAAARPASLPPPTPEELVARLTGGRVLGHVQFGVDQFTLSDATLLPAGARADTSQSLLLVVLSEPTNPRLGREAFSRLMAVRQQLLLTGYTAQQIQVKVLHRPEPSTLAADVVQSVFVIAVQR